MSYKFKAGETIANGIQRIAKEELDSAIAGLKGQTKQNPPQVVHDVRKRLKKLRALLRLVRYEIGEKTYKQENTRFRDAGRMLSSVRDAKILIETVEKLEKHYDDIVVTNAFSEIQEILVVHYQQKEEELLQKGQRMEEVAVRLEIARDSLSDWSIENNDWSVMEKGLKKVYKKGNKGLKKAYKSLSVENLHEWRKRVKDLWYHLQILQPTWSELMGEFVHQTHLLANDLGDDHDLAVLKDYLKTQLDIESNDEQLTILLGLIDRRRPELQLAAKALGERIYTEKPKRFVSRIGSYWEIWQSEHQPLS